MPLDKLERQFAEWSGLDDPAEIRAAMLQLPLTIVPCEFERLEPQPTPPDLGHWRIDDDGGDEHDPAETLRPAGGIWVSIDRDWLVNHPHSPRNVQPVFVAGTLINAGLAIVGPLMTQDEAIAVREWLADDD